MQLEADRFAHNQWADEEFSKELEVVKEERRLRTEDNPRALMYEALNADVFVASPYRRPIVGWMSDLDAMTPDDARAFYRRWYVPANAAVVVAGDVDVAAGAPPGRKILWQHPGRAPCPRASRASSRRRSGLRRIDFKAPAEQAYVALAFKVPGRCSRSTSRRGQDDDALALTVLAAVLDGYSGARLERALTQGDRPRGRQRRRLQRPDGAAGRSCSCSTACPPRARRPRRWRPRCASRWRALPAKACQRGRTQPRQDPVGGQRGLQAATRVFNQARELGSHWVQGLPLDANERLIARLRTVTADAGAGGGGALLWRRPADRGRSCCRSRWTRTASRAPPPPARRH